MSHIALYRSWRPQTFKDIVGQEHITRTLQNALEEGRLTHAYLFSGPRGTGKTSAAKILAKAVNCEQGLVREPCNQCSACLRITEGSVMDVIELDAASNNGVDEIRDIRDKVKYAPTEVRQKVYIIDEVHMLSIGASNALLKTLEEPPPHVMFILATTEPHKLPVTIISRCQQFNFHRVSLEVQVQRLRYICEQEQWTAEEDALQYVARLSDGGMRDALSLLDQIVSFSGTHISYQEVLTITGGIAADQFQQLAEAIQRNEMSKVLQIVAELMREGQSADRCIENLIHYYRDLLMMKLVPHAQSLTDRILDTNEFTQLAATYSEEHIYQTIDILNHYQVEMKYASQPQTLFEVAMMKACSSYHTSPLSVSGEEPSRQMEGQNQHQQQLSQLQHKVEQLERQLSDVMQSTASESLNSETNPANKPAAVSQSIRDRVPSSVGIRKKTVQLDAFIQEQGSARFNEVSVKWNQVLNKVKELKINVYAWLVNGDPVSASSEAILIAFKNTIHRETTEKPENKQLIEQVLEEMLGDPVRLETVMQKDWSAALSEAPQEPGEILQLEHEDKDGQSGKHKEQWINEAIELFGEDLVTIKEN